MIYSVGDKVRLVPTTNHIMTAYLDQFNVGKSYTERNNNKLQRDTDDSNVKFFEGVILNVDGEALDDAKRYYVTKSGYEVGDWYAAINVQRVPPTKQLNLEVVV